jgi:hypothetical protein
MTNKNRLFLFSYILLPAITAIVAINWLASIPSDSQYVILFGMTKSRLVIAGILFLAAMGFALLSILVLRQSEQAGRWLKEKLSSPRYLLISAISSGLIFFAACLFLAVPDKYMGELWAVEERLRPLVIWGLLVSLQMLVGLIGWQVSKRNATIAPLKSVVIPGCIALGILLTIWAFIAITRLGLIGENSFWSKVGVPILWPQVFLSLVIALSFQFLLTHFTKISEKRVWLDIGLCILIWLAAVILWNNQSYVQGVFNTPPRPPTNEIYPINDSLTFDRAAQKMLIGQGMISDALDKPIFIAYLAFMHMLAGIGFPNFYILQVISFAFIPVLGYFLGKSLHSRPLGMMFAVLLVIKEQNAITLTNYIHVSTSKMILSEMLTTLGVLLFTLFMVRWLKNPVQTNPNLWFAGGVLGLTSLTRLNSISILPAAVLLIGLALNFKWKPWATASILISIFVIVSTIPWLARNTASSGDPFSFIKNKTGGVLVNERYSPLIKENSPAPSNTTTPAQPPASKVNGYLSLGRGMATNYLHNLIGITVMLPPSLELYKLLDVVRLPYWSMEWDGNLLPGAFWTILGILVIIALGIASAWRRWCAAGLAPLVVILGYNITTAISLTSGGRYLVPIDWGVLLYFSIGLLDLATWLLTLFGWPVNNEPENAQTPKRQNGKTFQRLLMTSLIFLFIGTSPILLETLPPERYPALVNMDDFIKANQSLTEISSPKMAENITSLSKDPLTKVFYGRALYPRYFGENKGDGATLAEDPLIGSAGFDHLSFYLIGGKFDTTVILPLSAKFSPSIAGADAWVLGCQRTNYLEAILVVFRANGVARVYQQEPFKTNCQ